MSRRLLGQELRAYSLITWFFERVFWSLYLLSPSRLAGGSRVMHYRSEEFRLDPHGTTVRRSRRVEVYILGWFVIETGLLIMAGLNTGWPLVLPRVIASIRILDILQSSVNLSVFDQLRSRGTLMVSSAVRTLVLSFLNYLELIILFGVIYTSVNAQLVDSAGWLDALYFSVVTQLTIGYGDIRPVGVARLISSLQGLIAVAFTILIFGRIVSVLPRIESVMQHDAKDDAPPRA